MMFMVIKLVRDKSCRKKNKIKLCIKYNIEIYNSVEVLMVIPEASPSRVEGTPVALS